MNQTLKLILGVGIAFALPILAVLAIKTINQSKVIELSSNNFDATFTHSKGSWNYKIVGTLKNPCIEDNIIINKNDGMSKVNLILQENPEEFCVQIETDFMQEGSFEGGSQDNIEFEVMFELKNVENDKATGLDFDYEYQGENKWTYTIKDSLPNPCYQADANVTVAESFPEQVTIMYLVSEPLGDLACTQVINEVELKGEFSASEEAVIKLERETKESNTSVGNKDLLELRDPNSF